MKITWDDINDALFNHIEHCNLAQLLEVYNFINEDTLTIDDVEREE